MRRDSTTTDTGGDGRIGRGFGHLRRSIRAAAFVGGTLLILAVIPGASCVGDSTVRRSTPRPTPAPTATPAVATPTPRPVGEATLAGSTPTPVPIREPTPADENELTITGKGSATGSIHLVAGTYAVRMAIEGNDRFLAPDNYEFTVRGYDDDFELQGRDHTARDSGRYRVGNTGQKFWEIDVGDNATWTVSFVVVRVAGSTPVTPTGGPTRTPTPEPVPTPVPTATPTPGPPSTPTSASTPESSDGAPQEYVVQAGDTLRSIAEQFGTTIDSLIEANDIEDPELIRTGAILKIPVPATTAVDAAESSTTASPIPIPTSPSEPTTTPTVSPTPTPTSIQLELSDLLDEYDQNKVRADTRFRYQENGKRPVSTSGYVQQVEENYSTIAPTQARYPSQELNCYYADTRTALHIAKGQFVSVTGRVSGSTEYSNDVNMYACEFDGIQFESNPVVSIRDLRANVVQVFCVQEASVFGILTISSENKGTGVIIDPERGTILTVHHVVADENECDRIEVETGEADRRLLANILKHCASIDRARLRISPYEINTRTLAPIYRSSAPAQVDQEIHFWGYGPGRLRMGSGVVKEIWGNDSVTDAYAVPGDSGAPVLMKRGTCSEQYPAAIDRIERCSLAMNVRAV